MSRTFSRLNSSIRSFSPSFSSSSSSVVVSGKSRRYSASVLKPKPSEWKSSPRESQAVERHASRQVYADAAEVEADEGDREYSSQKLLGNRKSPSPFGKNKRPDARPLGQKKIAEDVDYSSMRAPDPIFAQHLNGLFPELHFPDELARRILTHASHPAAVYGHNAGLSFMGRRVLNAYLFLLLSSSPNLKPTDDLEEIVSRTLNHYVLGEHLGSKWGLGRVMRWTPTIKAERLKNGKVDQSALLKGVGLYKVQGDAVAAVIGGVFQQFGASAAHRMFHTRILPHILLTKGNAGLPEAFHGDARSACNRFGGMQGKLLREDLTSATKEERRLEIDTGKGL